MRGGPGVGQREEQPGGKPEGAEHRKRRQIGEVRRAKGAEGDGGQRNGGDRVDEQTDRQGVFFQRTHPQQDHAQGEKERRRETGGDPDKALKYLLMAADKDYAPAYTALGLLAHRGDGQGTAVEWFEKAAQEREPEGMFFFAVANNEGDGVEVDQAIARKYAVQVANHPGADENLKAKARHLIGEIDASQASMATLRD